MRLIILTGRTDVSVLMRLKPVSSTTLADHYSKIFRTKAATSSMCSLRQPVCLIQAWQMIISKSENIWHQKRSSDSLTSITFDANFHHASRIDMAVERRAKILIVDQFGSYHGRSSLFACTKPWSQRRCANQDETKTCLNHLPYVQEIIPGMTGTGKTEEEEFREVQLIRVIQSQPTVLTSSLLCASIGFKFR